MGEETRAGVLSDAQIEELAHEVREQARQSALEAVFACGKLLLDRCYGGSFPLTRTRTPNKRDSLRRLALHPACPYGRAQLHRYLRAYELCVERPEVLEYRSLTLSHILATTKLEQDERAAFLARAYSEGWTPTELTAHVDAHRKRTSTEKRGAPPATNEKRAGTCFRRCKRAFDSMAEFIAKAESIPPKAAEDLDRDLESLIEEATALRAELAEHTEPQSRRVAVNQ